MTDFDALERDMIAAARRGLSPSTADAARVRQATAHALATPDPSASQLPMDGAAGTSVGATGAWVKTLGVVAIAIGSGGVGYWLGLHAERDEAVAARLPSHAEASVPAAVAMQPSVMPPVSDAPHVLVPQTEPPVDAPVAAPATPTVAARRKPLDRKAEPVAIASLEEEVRVLKRVERALRAKDPRLAVELLNGLDRSVPNGKLLEERAAAFVTARCMLGAGTKSRLRQEFDDSYPDSVYLGRVAQACSE